VIGTLTHLVHQGQTGRVGRKSPLHGTKYRGNNPLSDGCT